MNKDAARAYPSESSQYRSLRILDELAANDMLTQRDLSRRLGIALGLVNSYIKNLAAKGFITVKNIPPKRYTYYLTPKGFSEKSRLAYDLLKDYTRIYREARNNFQKLFRKLEQGGTKCVLFAGSDEIAEFAYITLQETGLELAGIVDEDRKGELFFNRKIHGLSEMGRLTFDSIVVTSYLKCDQLYRQLVDLGIQADSIRAISFES